jgi:hypothetical protein
LARSSPLHRASEWVMMAMTMVIPGRVTEQCFKRQVSHSVHGRWMRVQRAWHHTDGKRWCQDKNLSNAVFYTTGLEVHPGLRGVGLATDCLSHGLFILIIRHSNEHSLGGKTQSRWIRVTFTVFYLLKPSPVVPVCTATFGTNTVHFARTG